MTQDPDAILNFVETVDIVEQPLMSPFESEDVKKPVAFVDVEQSVVVGSQIASFSEGFDPKLRSAVSNVFLLAQLAADKALKVQGVGTETWYKTYVATLAGLGLTDEGRGGSFQEVSGSFLKVHNAAVAIVKDLMGPPVAAAAMVVKVLESLSSINEDQPWITFFDQKSRRAEACQFQMAHGDAASGAPVMYLTAFELQAQRSLTQVLFFKSNTEEATLSYFNKTIALDPDLLSRVSARISEKLGAHVDANIEAIDIEGLP